MGIPKITACGIGYTDENRKVYFWINTERERPAVASASWRSYGGLSLARDFGYFPRESNRKDFLEKWQIK